VYHYDVHLTQHVTLIHLPDAPIALNSFLATIATSTDNAFTLTYGGYGPVTDIGFLFLVIQVFNSFIFLAVIIAESIPSKSGN